MTQAGQDVRLRNREDHALTSPTARVAATPPVAPRGLRGHSVHQPSMDHLHPKDCVRLREDYLDLPRGAVGVVIGFYRTEVPTVAVKFEVGLRKVPFDRLEPLGDDE